MVASACKKNEKNVDILSLKNITEPKKNEYWKKSSYLYSVEKITFNEVFGNNRQKNTFCQKQIIAN
jgi:hypothetical protein